MCAQCTHVSCYILSTQGQYMDGKVHKMQNLLLVLVEKSLLNSDWICQNVKDHSSNLTMQSEMDQASFNNLSLIFCFLDLTTDLKCHRLPGPACTLGTINLQQPLEDFHPENVLPPFSNVFAIVISSFADLQVVDPCDVLALAPSRRRAIAAGNQTTCGPTTCLWA